MGNMVGMDTKNGEKTALSASTAKSSDVSPQIPIRSDEHCIHHFSYQIVTREIMPRLNILIRAPHTSPFGHDCKPQAKQLTRPAHRNYNSPKDARRIWTERMEVCYRR
jgi:hypothetical protein